jgi:hypothetical protein
MAQAFKYASPGEAAVARRLVAAILSGGNSISVYDGEEHPVKRSANAAEIEAALAQTGEEWINAYAPDGNRLGGFMLVWGNAEDGEELIADHTDNRYCQDINAAVYGEGS